MRYRKPTFIQPPRPETAVHPDQLENFDNGSWVGQPKLNGTYSQIIVHPDRKLTTFRRDGSQHKQWAFTEASAKPFKDIPGNGYWVFCAELLHAKTPHIKDTNYIHDCLVANGELLIGKNYIERHAKIDEAFPARSIGGTKRTSMGYSYIDDHTWLADVFEPPFRSLYDRWTHADECEGIVLKDVRTPFSLSNPERGQVKCRRMHKNYGF